ncbi:hypothetical protein H0H93_001408, partial [Arthromyces matolae]
MGGCRSSASLTYSIVIANTEYKDLLEHIPGNDDIDKLESWLQTQNFNYTYIEDDQEHIITFAPQKPGFQNVVDGFGCDCGNPVSSYSEVEMPSEKEIEEGNKAFQQLQAKEFKSAGIKVKTPR